MARDGPLDVRGYLEAQRGRSGGAGGSAGRPPRRTRPPLPDVEQFRLKSLLDYSSEATHKTTESLLSAINTYRKDLSDEMDELQVSQSNLGNYIANVDSLGRRAVEMTYQRTGKVSGDLSQIRHVTSLCGEAEKTYNMVESIIVYLRDLDAKLPRQERLVRVDSVHKVHYPRLHGFLMRKLGGGSEEMAEDGGGSEEMAEEAEEAEEMAEGIEESEFTNGGGNQNSEYKQEFVPPDYPISVTTNIKSDQKFNPNIHKNFPIPLTTQTDGNSAEKTEEISANSANSAFPTFSAFSPIKSCDSNNTISTIMHVPRTPFGNLSAPVSSVFAPSTEHGIGQIAPTGRKTQEALAELQKLYGNEGIPAGSEGSEGQNGDNKRT